MRLHTYARLCLLCMAGISHLQAQTPVNASFYTHHLKAAVNSDGALFNNKDGGQFIPFAGAGSPTYSLLRGAGLWIAGLDPGGNLKGAVYLADKPEGYDFAPGLPNGNMNKIWRVTRDEIRKHNEDLTDNDKIDDRTPAIYAWPGRGNPHFSQYNPGMTLPNNNQDLADFYDYDHNGIYDPDGGDFPAVKTPGCPGWAAPPTELFWFVFHDDILHSQSGMQALPVEVHASVFIYDCLNDERLWNSVFVQFKVINRSAEPLSALYLGLYNDVLLGIAVDDYFGCDTSNNFVFAYNGDFYDEGGFGTDPPAMGVHFLAPPLTDSGAPAHIAHVVPVEPDSLLLPVQFYYQLRGLARDGSPLPDGGLPYNFSFDKETGNTEHAAGNAPGRRRILSAFGPFEMAPGASKEMLVAYNCAYPDFHTVPQQGGLYNNMLAERQFYQECLAFHDTPGCPNTLSLPPKTPGAALRLFPNPATQVLTIESSASIRQIRLFYPTGQLAFEQQWTSPQTRVSIPVAQMPAGVYLAEINLQENQIAREIVLINQ